MNQLEIDEISEAFLEAWEEYFGQPMFYIRMIEPEEVDTLYRETKHKKYDEENKLPFIGTFRQEPIVEKGDVGGRVEKEFAEITFVTKELFDQGMLECKSEDIIEITNRIGEVKRYNIIEHYGKVQFGDNRIFTKLKVVDLDV